MGRYGLLQQSMGAMFATLIHAQMLIDTAPD